MFVLYYNCSVIVFLLFQSIEDIINGKVRILYFVLLIPAFIMKLMIGINRKRMSGLSEMEWIYNMVLAISIILVWLILRSFIGFGDVLALLSLVILLGFNMTVLCIISSLIMVVLIGGIYGLYKKKSRGLTIPYIPYLTISVIYGFFL